MTLEEIFTGATSAEKWRELGKYLRTTRIKGGVGIRVMQNNIGTIISGGSRGGGSSVGGEAAKIAPLSIVSVRPPYIPESSPPAANTARFYLTWGFCNGVLADNWQEYIDIPTIGADAYKYLFLKATISPIGNDIKVIYWEWLSGNTPHAHETPAWASPTQRPPYFVTSLGMLYRSGGVVTPYSSGGGSMQVNEYIYSIDASAAPAVVYQKTITVIRLLY